MEARRHPSAQPASNQAGPSLCTPCRWVARQSTTRGRDVHQVRGGRTALLAALASGCVSEMRIGGSNVGERTPESEGDETWDREPEAGDSAAGSAAEQAKEREREMEESGEENAG